jgi:23S rRNA (cytidine1920-2'-O)/16S rRNA (cytidine1409-2'-O)-methyltransferase
VPKTRVDVLLEQRGLAPTRQKAQALILAGVVFSGDRRVDKAGEKLDDEAELSVKGEDHPFVSRGGVKLTGALDAFAFDPAGHVAADFGASTGGFTDCLLQRGATRVYAIDVGYGQLHHKLREDPRVVVMERVNARHLVAGALPEPVSLVVIDASFIGLEKLLPAAHALLREGGRRAGHGEAAVPGGARPAGQGRRGARPRVACSRGGGRGARSPRARLRGARPRGRSHQGAEGQPGGLPVAGQDQTRAWN